MSKHVSGEEYGVSSKAQHSGCEPENWRHMPLVPPIITTSTFKQVAPGVHIEGFDYSRHFNPTRTSLQECLAGIENAKHCLAFSSGMAAATTICHLLKSGDNIALSEDVYAGTARLMSDVLSQFNISTTLVDFSDTENFDKQILDSTKMIWLESPTNPLLKIVDIKRIVEKVKKKNPEILTVIDNTFLTPYLQRPLELGIDISHYSLSKFLNGHSDVVMGALCVNDTKLYERLHYLQKALGTTPSPFDCSMVNRSLKTLPVRMERHLENAMNVAKYLEKHEKVLKVLYPGLKNHPKHDVCSKQSKGFGGVVCFYIKGGFEEASKFATSLKMIDLADSLGGSGSTVVLPSIATRGYVDPKKFHRNEVTDNLIRFSVGLEDIEDIVRDLDQAFEKI